MSDRCAIYCRVSSSDQDVEPQKRQLPEFAKTQGWPIHDIYIDDGISGADIESRPDFKRLLEDMMARKFEILLVQYQDRVTRSDNLAERGLILQTLKESNIILWSPTEGPADLSDFSGEITSTIKFIIAAQERKRIAERMYEGREKWMSMGVPMYSCKIYGRKWTVIKTKDKKGLKEVVWEADEDKLNRIRRAGKYMVEQNLGWDKASKAEGIRKNTLINVIKNCAGSTFTQWNRAKSLGLKKRHTFTIPEECQIFDDAYVRKILRSIKDRDRCHGREPKYRYLCNRILKDSYGHTLKTSFDQSVQRLFYERRSETTKFKKPYYRIPCDVIEPVIMEAITCFLSYPERYQEVLYGGKDKTKVRKKLSAEIKSLEREIKNLDRELDRLDRNLTKINLDDEEDQKKFNDMRSDIKTKKEKRLEQIENRKKEMDNIPDPQQLEAHRQALLDDLIRTDEEVARTFNSLDNKARDSLRKQVLVDIKKEEFKERILSLPFEKKKALLRKIFPPGRKHGTSEYGIFINRPQPDEDDPPYTLIFRGVIGFTGLWYADEEGHSLATGTKNGKEIWQIIGEKESVKVTPHF